MPPERSLWLSEQEKEEIEDNPEHPIRLFIREYLKLNSSYHLPNPADSLGLKDLGLIKYLQGVTDNINKVICAIGSESKTESTRFSQ
jgi:hypothetical protein